MSHRVAADCISLLSCPVCTEPLAGAGRTLRCPRGHAFDFAREGHVDLLPAGHGRSTLTGDTAEMLRARRRFLERGWFAPLARALEDCRAALRRALADGVAPDHGRGLVLLEAGCGEGYFIGGLAAPAHRTAAAPDADCCFGLDISRDALRMAARRHPGVLFFRNDVHHRICLRDGCVDLLLDIFAPRNPREFRRVLRPSGMLVVVIPAAAHLAELRAALPLIGMEPEKLDRTVERFRGAFVLEGHDAIEFRAALEGVDVADLVQMTPSARHLDERARAQAAALGPLDVTFALDLLRFRPAPVPVEP